MRGTRWGTVLVLSVAGLLALPSPASAAAWDSYSSYDTSGLAEVQAASRVCVACHVEAMLGTQPVYRGADEYAYGSAGAHSERLTPCLACHVTHDETGMRGAVAPKRLRIRAYQQEFVRDFAAGDARLITEGLASAPGWTPRDIQITAFCTGCHPLYTSDADLRGSIAEDGAEDEAVAPGSLNHPLRPASPGSAGSPRIAAIASTGCRSCHAAGTTDGGADPRPSFPHSTPDNPLFLVSAARAEDVPEPPANPLQDGVCLRCHRWTDADGGYGGVGSDW